MVVDNRQIFCKQNMLYYFTFFCDIPSIPLIINMFCYIKSIWNIKSYTIQIISAILQHSNNITEILQILQILQQYYCKLLCCMELLTW